MSKLNKLMRLPEIVPCDKRLHFMLGTVFTVIVGMFTRDLFVTIGTLVLYAWGIEVYQKITKSGTYDNWDAIAVVLGGLVVIGDRLW